MNKDMSASVMYAYIALFMLLGPFFRVRASSCAFIILYHYVPYHAIISVGCSHSVHTCMERESWDGYKGIFMLRVAYVAIFPIHAPWMLLIGFRD